MRVYKETLETRFFWLIPFVIGFSKSNVDNKAKVFALHITPFLEIGFNWKNVDNLKNTGHDPLMMNTDDPLNSIIDHF